MTSPESAFTTTFTQDMELQPLSCDAGVPWDDGNKVLEYIKEVEYFGLTGEIMFDGDGFRTHFTLDLMEKFHNRMKKTAIWTEKGELVIFHMVFIHAVDPVQICLLLATQSGALRRDAYIQRFPSIPNSNHFK